MAKSTNIACLKIELVTYGEHNYIDFSHSTTHTNNSLNIIGRISDEIWELEIHRLQLMIAHKDDIIQAKDEALRHKDAVIDSKNELLQQQKREIDTLNLLIKTLQPKPL